MDNFDPQYQTFPLHEHIPANMSLYVDEQSLQTYAMAQQQTHMVAMSNQVQRGAESKPRLAKEDVAFLESAYEANRKPTTQTKRGYAEGMGVDLPRINNWFQNRRAKEKNLRKQEEFRKSRIHELSDVESSDECDEDAPVKNEEILPVQRSAQAHSTNGPPPAVAPYNPRYANPASASMESLQRTIAAAQAAQHTASPELSHNFFEPVPQQGAYAVSPEIIPSTNFMSFPSRNGSSSSFEMHPNYSYPNPHHTRHLASHQPHEVQESAQPLYDATEAAIMLDFSPGAVSNFSPPVAELHSQLVLLNNHDQHSHSHSPDFLNSEDTPDNDRDASTTPVLKIAVPEANDQSTPLPTSTLPRAPPSAGIASRRPKVHNKPAALGLDLSRGRPQMGPRTISHAEGFRRPSDSPMGSPMRRIVSAGGNRNGMGRVQKTGVESAQRSPINFGNFSDAGAFMERNLHNIRNPSAFSANNLAPPTPLSPKDQFIGNIQSDGDNSYCSSVGNVNYFNSDSTYIQAPPQVGLQDQNGDQNFASPPVTPENALGLNITSSDEWSNAPVQENDWYGVPEALDAPIYTPAQDHFNLEIQMPQPGYVHSLSQPVTPAMYQHPPNVFLNQESSPLDSEGGPYPASFPNQQEYSFPDSYAQFYVSPASKQKTFQFSNSTPADFVK